MVNFLAQNKDVLDVLMQLVILVVPVVISWLIRNYVKNTGYEKQIASIIALSNTAIDYVENLEKRGSLTLPEGASKGLYKLSLASEWLEGELNRNGINVSSEEASKWISAEFQKRMGGVQTSSKTSEFTRMAVDLIQDMVKGGLNDLINDPEKMDILIGMAADWLSAKLIEQRGVQLTHQEAETWVRAEVLQRVQVKQLPSGDSLMDLARQAVAYVTGLKASGRLALKPGTAGASVDTDIAIAWALTEAVQLGLTVTPDEIAKAVNTVLQQRRVA